MKNKHCVDEEAWQCGSRGNFKTKVAIMSKVAITTLDISF